MYLEAVVVTVLLYLTTLSLTKSAAEAFAAACDASNDAVVVPGVQTSLIKYSP